MNRSIYLTIILLSLASIIWGGCSKTPGEHLRLGRQALEEQDLAGAESHFLKAIEKMPEFTEAHYYLGYVKGLQGNSEAEEDQYRKVVELDPKHAQAHFSLGIIHRERGELDLAEKEYLRATEIDPQFAQVYNNLGYLYFRQMR